MSAAIELQKAVVAALTSDNALVGLLGGAKVYDHAPPQASFPYITLGRTSLFDWSTGTESGEEQILTLHVWSKGQGKKQALEIIERAGEALRPDALALTGVHLVCFRQEYSEVRFDEDLSVYHGLLRFRALVEPNA
ncbi:DUF3168 domain-containing protein [Pseudaminobacter sp. 19-2017]|uniref:DUF3168 domain-containing protein n=1 Tax=Pseudaminobacter soli (ex Zhang et al. 2022) TaxID=2831468 RepID=A0A942DYZ0_9HYPH|nr:DUF3168 domain-containing protein [Pseudaminobacter soli]MBS3650799.1 DUF3168 domain-containing protein [Pseudaminobacter soli]